MRPRSTIAAACAALLVVACTSESSTPPNGAGPPDTTAPPSKHGHVDWFEAACGLPLDYLERVRRGYFPGRSPELLFVPKEPAFFGGLTSTSHSGPWPYVQEVPLVFYGPGFIRARGDVAPSREVTLADLAPTLAELLHTDAPPGVQGRPVTEALVPEEKRARRPRLIVTLVWDGGGWNVLNQWPDAWPFLAHLMSKGTSVTNATAGSSPSVTPAIHTTIGTGVYPERHGIIDIPLRVDGDTVLKSAIPGGNPRYIKAPTLADVYDRSTGNAAEIGMMAYVPFHIGMMGHGSYLEGGDQDIAVIPEREPGDVVTRPGVIRTDYPYYSVPSYVHTVPGFEEDFRSVDLEDGELDSRWRGHDLTDPSHVRHSPVWILYQTRLLEAVLEREGFGSDEVSDLFFVNYKQIDDAGHNWNMLYEEMEDTLRYSDGALKDLVGFLNDEVGRRQWVLAMTADHGQAPDPVARGIWPIQMNPLLSAVAAHFDVERSELFQDERPVGFWLDRDYMKANGITLAEVADFVVNYRIEDSVSGVDEVPEQYRGRMKELLFDAALPGRSLDAIWACARKRQ